MLFIKFSLPLSNSFLYFRIFHFLTLQKREYNTSFSGLISRLNGRRKLTPESVSLVKLSSGISFVTLNQIIGNCSI